MKKGKAVTLEELRTQKAMSQKDLAIVLGCTQAAISFWEGGKRIPSLKMAIRIGTLFDVPVDSIQFGSK